VTKRIFVSGVFRHFSASLSESARDGSGAGLCRCELDFAGRRIGYGRIAANLGKVDHGELADAVQLARQRLSATKKGKPIEPATGARIALGTFRASGEHWR
jgi:hypothetical protein